MKMIKNMSLVAMVVALAACGSDENMNQMNNDLMNGEYENAMQNVALASLPVGISEGSVEDFMARAGEEVLFDYDQYSLSSEAREVLLKQSLWLRMFPDTTITVEGHCDERGTRKYNFALGERRANSVKRYLIANGVSASRIDTVSYGKEKPAVEGHNSASWAQNRRGISVLVK